MNSIIIYLHGFNSGPGEKTEELKKNFPELTIISPQLPVNPIDAINLIKSIIDENPKATYHIIGTSLGGFYAMYLSSVYGPEYDIIYYVINPAFLPHISLKKYENKALKNYKTGIEYTIGEKELIASSVLYDTLMSNYNDNSNNSTEFFISTHDDVLNYTELFSFLRSFKHGSRITHINDNHRVENFEPILKTIKDYLRFF